MNCRTCAHAPALKPHEAALLPALAPGYPTMPLRSSDFRPVEAVIQKESCRPRSAAGKAILHARGVQLPGVERRNG